MTWSRSLTEWSADPSRSGDSRTGFRYDYRLATALGGVIISPVSLDRGVYRAMPMPNFMVM